MAEPASRTCKHCRHPRGAPRGCPFLLHPISASHFSCCPLLLLPIPSRQREAPRGTGWGSRFQLPRSPRGAQGSARPRREERSSRGTPGRESPELPRAESSAPGHPLPPSIPPGWNLGARLAPLPPPPKPGALLGGASTVSKLSPPSPSTKPEARKDKNVVEVKSDKLAEEAGLLQGANGERGPTADQVGPGGPAGHGGVGQGWERSRGAQGVPEVTLLSSPSAPHPAWAP